MVIKSVSVDLLFLVIYINDLLKKKLKIKVIVKFGNL